MGRVPPFGDLRIKGCSRLPAAFRSVPRPSSPLNAKASTKCPYLTLDPPEISTQVQTTKSSPNPKVPIPGSFQFQIRQRPSRTFMHKIKDPMPKYSLRQFLSTMSNSKTKISHHRTRNLVEAIGIEPTTCSLQSYRSPN